MGLYTKNRPGRTSKWIRRARRLAIYIRDGFGCLYCGADLREAEPSGIHLDHLTPRVRGGSHKSTNLATACAGCNLARGDRPWREFAAETSPDAIARILRHRRRRLNLSLARAILRGDESPIPF